MVVVDNSDLCRNLIAGIRANGIDKFGLPDWSIDAGLDAVIKKLEKNGFKFGLGDKVRLKGSFTRVGFRYHILDLGVSGICYIQLSEEGAEDYISHFGGDVEFYKALAKRFMSRASRYRKVWEAKRNRDHDYYRQQKEEKRKAYFERLKFAPSSV